MENYKYLIMGAVIIICKMIDVIAKTKRISKLEKLDESKIESIGKYEQKSKSNFSIFNIGKNKADET